MTQNGGNYRFTRTSQPQDFNNSPGVAQWRANNALRREAEAEQAAAQAAQPEPERPFNPVDPTLIQDSWGMVSSEEAARNRAALKALTVGVAVWAWQKYRNRNKS